MQDEKKWEVLNTEYLYQRPWLTARRDHVKLPTGVEIQEFYVLEYPDFCNVIAIDENGKYIMERQYRHACGLTSYEIPAGCVEKGEEPLAAAQRELLEETGYSGGKWSLLLKTCPNAGACTNYSYTFVAEGVKLENPNPDCEITEDIDVILVSQEELIQKLKNDEIMQAMMVAPLWKYFSIKGLV